LRVGGLHFGYAHPVRTGEHRGAQLEIDRATAGGQQAQTLNKQVDAVTMNVN
jgi:flagellar motor switch protein FliM